MDRIITGLIFLLMLSPVFAATRVDLSSLPASYLANPSFSELGVGIDEQSRSMDFNHTLHIRTQETYRGYNVLGADSIVHVPEVDNATIPLVDILKKRDASMNGFIYEGLYQDLVGTPAYVFNAQQMEKASEHAIAFYQHQGGKNNEVKDVKSSLIVYLDQKNKAHWAFHISFFVPGTSRLLPEKPAYILDAINFDVYKYWNDLHTIEKAYGGGFGGNHKTGKKIFDGLKGHQAKFEIDRVSKKNICYMKNKQVIVADDRIRSSKDTVQFKCPKADPKHNNVFWSGSVDTVEGAWSPSNDVMFGVHIANNMFKDWYKMPVLEDDGKPMVLDATVHDPMANAYWYYDTVTFGDSVNSKKYNPFTSLDTVVHEMCHGFTENHSHLHYSDQSGGLNEAFSDMAGIAAEFYAYGKTDFLIGFGDVKEKDKALRYMEQPSKDCGNRKPGQNCSIDKLSQYHDNLNVHYSSGVFDHAYYLLATTKGWDAKKAFDVMVKANMHYWTSETNFKDAACGVMKATKDYHYDLSAPAKAFKAVGIDTKDCLKKIDWVS